VSNITAPVAIIYGASDGLVDAEKVITHLKTCVMHKKIAQFEHLELIWSDRAYIEIFPSIIELLHTHKPKHREKSDTIRQ
jgi:lysosomal acid lipase/cholesteryl ester hydrolase